MSPGGYSEGMRGGDRRGGSANHVCIRETVTSLGHKTPSHPGPSEEPGEIQLRTVLNTGALLTEGCSWRSKLPTPHWGQCCRRCPTWAEGRKCPRSIHSRCSRRSHACHKTVWKETQHKQPCTGCRGTCLAPRTSGRPRFLDLLSRLGRK